jgi:hypothetical protein
MICCIETNLLDVEQPLSQEGLKKLEALQQQTHLQLHPNHHPAEDPNSQPLYMMKAGEKTKKK